MWRKIFSVLLVFTLALGAVPTYAQDATPMGFLGLLDIELALYGQAGEGPIVPRLEKAELDVFGAVQTDATSITMRVERLSQLLGGAGTGVSMILQLNAIEWMTFQKVVHGQPFVRRIESIERAFYGQISNRPVNERIAALSRALWGSDKVHVAQQQVPTETTVRISTLTEINSAAMKVGDPVRYRVVDSVIINNNVVIPAGAEGVGRVTEVRTAGRIGRDGLVTVEWGEITAIDGTLVKVGIGAKATERNQNSAELATGAAMAGVILLGPLGLAAGALVTGKDHVVPIGTQFYAEVTSAKSVNALSLIPLR